MCAWFWVSFRQKAVSAPWLLGWTSSRDCGQLFLLIIWWGHRAWWRGKVGVHYLFFLSWAFQMCVYMCERLHVDCLSIACSYVAKQPCVCMLEWGLGRERSTRSTDRHSQASQDLIEHIGTPNKRGWPVSFWLDLDVTFEFILQSLPFN